MVRPHSVSWFTGQKTAGERRGRFGPGMAETRLENWRCVVGPVCGACVPGGARRFSARADAPPFVAGRRRLCLQKSLRKLGPGAVVRLFQLAFD